MTTQEPHISARKWNYAPCGMQVDGTPCLCVCMRPTVVGGAGGHSPTCEYRTSIQGPILKQNSEPYKMTNSVDLYMNNVPFLHIKVAWSLKLIAILRMLSL